jgi:hypothetical protein
LLALRPYLKNNPDTVLAVIRTLSEAIYFYKAGKGNDPQNPRQVFKNRRSRGARRDPSRDRHQVDAGKSPTQAWPESKPFSDETALRNPKAKGLRPEDFVDSSFVKKVDDEGLFERLYKK